jgi:hypothetical protein
MPEVATDDPPDLAGAASPPAYPRYRVPRPRPPEVRDASPPGIPSFEIPPDVREGAAGLLREKIGAEKRVAEETFAGLGRDRARAEAAFNASGIGPHDVEKWDADQEFARRQSDPLERFGSLASVVGILGAAFTHQPLINSLNASAAAMEAIKSGEKESYERAHEAWKQNSDLVIKRANLMHQHYQDAVELMRTNLTAGEAKMRVVATQFGDKQALFLIENGLNADLLNLIEKREKASVDYAEHAPKAMEAMEKAQDLAERTRGLKKGSPEYDAVVRAHYAAFDPYAARKPQDASELYREFVEKFPETHEGRQPTPEEKRDFLDTLPGAHKRGGASGNTSLTIQRQNAKSAQEYKQKLLAEGKSEAEAEKGRVQKYAELSAAATPVPAGKAVDLRLMIGQLDRASRKIDDLEAAMKKHGMITGLGGKIRRPAETIADILGGDATAAKEFQANLSTLQQWVSQRIDNKLTSGRPLSAAEMRMQDIVPGLKLGDTVQFVTKQLRTLQKDLLDMKREDEAILAREPSPSGPAPAKGGEPPAWQRLGVPSSP